MWTAASYVNTGLTVFCLFQCQGCSKLLDDAKFC